MSGIFKAVGKVFKTVAKVVKAIAPIALTAAAIYFTGGAAAGAFGTAAGVGGAAAGVGGAAAGASGGFLSTALGYISKISSLSNIAGMLGGGQTQSPADQGATDQGATAMTGVNSPIPLLGGVTAYTSSAVPGTSIASSAPATSAGSTTQTAPNSSSIAAGSVGKPPSDTTGGLLKSLSNNAGLFIAGGNILSGYAQGKAQEKIRNQDYSRELAYKKVPVLQSVYAPKV